MTIVIDIDDCRDGDISAKSVFDSKSYKLIDSNTLLTDHSIEFIKNHGVKHIEVQCPCGVMREKNFKLRQLGGVYKENVTKVKDMICNVASGRQIEVNTVDKIANEIYSNINTFTYDDVYKLMKNIRTKDEYTYFHCVNVAFYSSLMAKWLKLSETETKRVIQAGFLHDIGKARVPLDVLNKPSALTEEEFEKIKKHPIYGYRILEESNFPDSEIKTAVLMHHERVNRTGYPFIISPSKIGITARIIAIADVYDAMTSDRVYKKKKTPFEAFDMFKTSGYTDFDVHIAQIFVNNMSESFVGADISLTNGDKGKIIYVPANNNTKPVIETPKGVFPLYENGINIEDIL